MNARTMNARKPMLGMLTALCALACGLAFSIAPALAAPEYLAEGSFGGTGAGAGQLEAPQGVAVNDLSGDVYVADTGNRRIDEFEADGTFIRAFGENVGGLGVNVCGGLTSCEAGASGSAPGQFESPSVIAVDNSTDASAGDVYVGDTGDNAVTKFTSTGAVEKAWGVGGQLKQTTPGSPFGYLQSVTVDPAGNVWVEDSPEEVASSSVAEFSDTGVYVKAFATGQYAGPGSRGLAVDSAGDLYLNTCCEGDVVKFVAATGEKLSNPFAAKVSDLALSPATENLLLDQKNSIALYGPGGEPYSTPLQTFAGGSLSESYGIAVESSGTVYATEREADEVELFSDRLATEAATVVAEDSELLQGSINPAGEKVTGCRFEYETETGVSNMASCKQTSAEIGQGTSPVAVSAEVNGLTPRTVYNFRLADVNGHGLAEHGQEQTFFTAASPLVEGEESSNIGPTSATVGAQVDAAGLQTTVYAEYGTSAAYGSLTPTESIGAPQSAVGVDLQLSGLAPGTAYHVRFIATNALGTTPGEDFVVSTTPTAGRSSSQLPDGRVYEPVSPVASEIGENYVPRYADISEIDAEHPFQASSDGNALAYVGTPSPTAGDGSTGTGNGNQWLAVRTASGWSASDITPDGSQLGTIYEAFSPDLTTGILISTSPLNENTSSQSCEGLYSRANPSGAYAALIAPRMRSAGGCELLVVHTGEAVFAGGNEGTSGPGGVPRYSDLLYQTPAALTPGATPAEGEGHYNLYESLGGRLQAVNVLGGVIVPEAEFGSSTGEQVPNFTNVISADGSRVFWTDVETGVVYLREDASSTIQVSAGPAAYWTASRDGRYAFYTEAGKLMRFDSDLYKQALEQGATESAALAGAREQLAGESAQVQGVLGASADGSTVYFVAGGALVPGATPQTCKEAEGEHEYEERNREVASSREQPELHGENLSGRGCNLYALHVGEQPDFIATLAPRDGLNHYSVPHGAYPEAFLGDWQPSLQTRTAQVTPDGQHLLFESVQRLTGYDNGGAVHEGSSQTPRARELFLFEASTGKISCATCSPRVAPNLTSEEAFGVFPGGELGGVTTPTYQPRWLSESGKRVFFDSKEGLVPQDANGQPDVYQWEQDGEGGEAGCHTPGGCTDLISNGEGSDANLFVDASANGNDVFFTTRQQLVPSDQNDFIDVYDARVGGGFETTASGCTGTGCQGVPSAPPTFATPASATFAGVGNFPPRVATPKKVVKKTVKCKQGLSKNKKGKCVRKKSRKSKQAKHERRGK